MRSGASNYYGVFREANPKSIKPTGWLAEMLRRQVEGLATHHEVSGYPFDTCMWKGKIPTNTESLASWWPYEQAGYLVDGLERLGILTGDSRIVGEAQDNLDATLASQKANGTIGPSHIGTTNWPHAVVFRGLMAKYDAKSDPTILQALTKHYLSRPKRYGRWRDVTNIEEILWTFSHTGDQRLLQVALNSYETFNRDKPKTSAHHLASNEVIGEHGVTFNETAKIPAILYLYTGDVNFLNAAKQAYEKVDRDHMLASGLHSSEEALRGMEPTLYHETCNIADYTWSVGYLLMATGQAKWADRIEKVVFNAGMGSISKDFRSHQYFSSPNQPQATHGIKSEYHGDRMAFRPGHVVECCSGNVHRFLPNYALRQWMVTPPGGVAAVLYAPSRFESEGLVIDQETQYPFEEEIRFRFLSAPDTAIPFHFRIPEWATGASCSLNGSALPNVCTPGSFETIDRVWAAGDVLTLSLPMKVRLQQWGANVSFERGPLVYTLKIEEGASEVFGYKTAKDFPAWDIKPESKWNYGVVVDPAQLSHYVTEVMQPREGFPWDAPPLEIHVRGREIANWKLPKDHNPKIPLKPKPLGQTMDLALVPYGSTRIRMTVLPIVKSR